MNKIDIITAYYNQNVYLTEYFTWLDKFILPEFEDKVNIIFKKPLKTPLTVTTRTNIDKDNLSLTKFNEKEKKWKKRAGGTNLLRDNTVNQKLLEKKLKDLKVEKNILRFNYKLKFSNN